MEHAFKIIMSLAIVFWLTVIAYNTRDIKTALNEINEQLHVSEVDDE